MKTRAYRKTLRAQAEEATRGRIVDALIELHEEVGPSRTTVSAVAERAGVERLTVYRHFPDENAMIYACSARWASLHPHPPLPRPSAEDPIGTCRRELLRLYGWYRANERMLEQVTRDAERIPAVATAMTPFARHLDALASALDRAWPRRSRRRMTTLRHAAEFPTWRSLSQLAGSDRAAVEIVVGWLQ